MASIDHAIRSRYLHRLKQDHLRNKAALLGLAGLLTSTLFSSAIFAFARPASAQYSDVASAPSDNSELQEAAPSSETDLLEGSDGSEVAATSDEVSESDSSTDDSNDPTADDRTVPPSTANQEWVAAWVTDLKHSNRQWIQVDLSDQRLVAWEGDTPVFSVIVSTGRPSDSTPTGVYAIETKYQTARMQGDGYDIKDVPYVMYFSGSYAIHGTYWHQSFGTPVSRGCVNVPASHATWLFDWASVGTAVVVQE